eukprot:COSAG04_NODE_75_length_28792_cov_4.615272_17_plen_364_part_00
MRSSAAGMKRPRGSGVCLLRVPTATAVYSARVFVTFSCQPSLHLITHALDRRKSSPQVRRTVAPLTGAKACCSRALGPPWHSSRGGCCAQGSSRGAARRKTSFGATEWWGRRFDRADLRRRLGGGLIGGSAPLELAGAAQSRGQVGLERACCPASPRRGHRLLQRCATRLLDRAVRVPDRGHSALPPPLGRHSTATARSRTSAVTGSGRSRGSAARVAATAEYGRKAPPRRRAALCDAPLPGRCGRLRAGFRSSPRDALSRVPGVAGARAARAVSTGTRNPASRGAAAGTRSTALPSRPPFCPHLHKMADAAACMCSGRTTWRVRALHSSGTPAPSAPSPPSPLAFVLHSKAMGGEGRGPWAA